MSALCIIPGTLGTRLNTKTSLQSSGAGPLIVPYEEQGVEPVYYE